MTLSSKHSGFTLIELMIVVVILSIVAAIAIPSYRQYVKLNHEKRVKSLLQNYAIQLEQWRAKTLTYAGFTPSVLRKNDSASNQGDFEADNITINYPGDSTAAQALYTITISAVSNDNPATFSAIKSSTLASRWIIQATPNSNDFGLLNLSIASNGVTCQNASSMSLTNIWAGDCGTGGSKW